MTRFRQAFSLLYRYPAFGRLWLGRLVSLFGDAFALIALPWFVLQLTESGTATAGILLTLQLPAIATSIVIGSLIDRFQPRAIIAIDNGLRTLIIGLIPLLYWSGVLEIWLLFLLTFLAGMLVPATEVGSRSVLPDLVDSKDLDAANMLWSFSLNLSLVIGPAVAGILIASFGGPSVLLIDAATFAVMAFAALTLPILKPILVIIILLRGIWMFNKFDVIWIMTKGGPLGATEHLPILTYQKTFQIYDIGGGTAVATISFLILFAIVIIYLRVFPIED